MSIRNFLPYFLKKRLWGDRDNFGLVAEKTDPSWREWHQIHTEFYKSNQRGFLGGKVNDIGYSILKKIDLENKNILEIGAGDIRHINFWRGQKPYNYVLADISNEMMGIAENKLKVKNIKYEKLLLDNERKLPLDDESVDIVISFYSLEHIYPLEEYLREVSRVLKKDGLVVGAIPSEGGIVWGLGRYFTSRRWFKKNTQINPDKIICWEHPNFADYIIKNLDLFFKRKMLNFEPFKIPFIDTNLIIKFIYIKE